MQKPDRRVLLKQRKQATEAAWNLLVNDQPLPAWGNVVHPEIASSWQRCLQHLNPWKASVPLDTCEQTVGWWEGSPLKQAIQHMQDELVQLVEEGSLVTALADANGCLLWTAASQHMQQRATRIHFVPGGRWDEHSAGTNAIGQALLLRQNVVVFASEHYFRHLHDWVGYAAPILYPRSGELAGIFCVATTWERHTPLGEMAVAELARSIQRHLPANQPRAELQIHALGFPRVLFRGKEIHCSQRQLEILCLLALNPQGLTLAALHSSLYGDEPVALTTLKVELSHLRHLLDGQIGSRPYRLMVSSWADFVTLWRVLKDKKGEKAMSLYRGPLLPHSTSPELEEWRNCIEAVMEQVVATCDDPDVLLTSLCNGVQGSERVRERLAELAVRESY